MIASDRTLIWLSVWLCCMARLYGQTQPLQQQEQYQQQNAPVRAIVGLQRGPATVRLTQPQYQTVKQQPQQTEIIWEKIVLLELPVIREQQQSQAQPQPYFPQPTNRQQFETQPQRNVQKLQNQQYYPKVQTNRSQLQIPEPQSRITQQQHQQTSTQSAESYQPQQQQHELERHQQQLLPQQQQQSFPNYKYKPFAEQVAPNDGLFQYSNVNNTPSSASVVPSPTAGAALVTTTLMPADAQINLFSQERDFANDGNATTTCTTCCDPMETICSSCCDVVPFLSSQTLKSTVG